MSKPKSQKIIDISVVGDNSILGAICASVPASELDIANTLYFYHISVRTEEEANSAEIQCEEIGLTDYRIIVSWIYTEKSSS